MAQAENLHFYDKDHNHNTCISSAMKKAEEVCESQNVRFTPLRKRIFELIWSNHKPVLAYDLLSQLRDEKRNAEPPTVYRVLDFLLEHHLIHKIETLNAYVGCQYPDRPHLSQFLICSKCNQFTELDASSIRNSINHEAEKAGFDVAHQTIEISGTCPQCK